MKKQSSTKKKNSNVVKADDSKSDFHKYDKFILTDDIGKPMAWGGEQLCYCTTDYWQDKQFPVKIYKKNYAKRLIVKSQLFRERSGYDVPQYRLMPVG